MDPFIKIIYKNILEDQTAFDKLDRRVLWATMRRRGVYEGIIRRIARIYAETKCTVRIGDEV